MVESFGLAATQALQRKCDSFEGAIRVVQLDAARVFHVGDCNGMHQKSGCTNAGLVDVIRKQLFTYSDNMFPDQVCKARGRLLLQYPRLSYVSIPRRLLKGISLQSCPVPADPD